MFKGETLGAVGGRLYPWQHGPHAKSGRGGGVPMSGTPSHADVATERWLRFSHCEFMLHTEDSITVFNSRVAPACFTLAPSVTRLGAEAPLRAFQTARLLQATGSVPVTFAVPFCTRPDPGEDDYSLVIGSSFASWRTPSCMGRRMAQTGANLLDHVLPPTPMRQFVLTLPFELRRRLAYDGKVLSAVGRIFVDSVLGFYRRRMRTEGVTGGQSGAVTVVQRCNSDLKLNPHWHGLFVDGVFGKQAAGSPVFHPLPRLATEEVGDLLQVVRVRILSHLARRGVIEAGPELTVLDDGFAEREPALAQLAAASVAGLAPAGPELRRRPDPVPLRGHPGVQITAPLSVTEMGFSLHAATRAGAEDARAREALCKYILRPPLSQERLHLLPDGLVRIELRKPYRDGTYAIDMDPLSLLCRLATSIPPETPSEYEAGYDNVVVPREDHAASPPEIW
jgi:hypothetical protein